MPFRIASKAGRVPAWFYPSTPSEVLLAYVDDGFNPSGDQDVHFELALQ